MLWRSRCCARGTPSGSSSCHSALRPARPFTDNAGHAARDLRRPGGHRHRERAAVQELPRARTRRRDRGARAADGDREILRVIASSPTDLQPVMEAVAENAARVCGATDSSIFRLEGEHLRLVARHGTLRRPMTIGDTIPVSRGSLGGRVVGDRRTIHVEDILAAEAEFPETVSRLRQAGSLPGQCWRHRCCARARRWASSSSIGGLRSIPSRPSRSRFSRRSPTRR